MLEKPDIPDQSILSLLEGSFGLQVQTLAFLPLGADVNTAVFRVVAQNKTVYFLKLRKETFSEITVTVPQFLNAQGIHGIIAPLETTSRQLWASLEPYQCILYPFIAGKDGYEASLSDQQWLAFGSALKNIHSANLPPAVARLVPGETFSPYWRDMTKNFQALVEETTFEDPTASQLAAFMNHRRTEINQLVARAESLGLMLKKQSLKQVLCHSDIHAGNLLLGADDALYIVDWDNPIFAPKERDLMLLGGCSLWNNLHQTALFYQGYGQTEIDQTALAYYRCERVIWDIAAYCQQILLSTEGGKDREQGLVYFTSSFLPNHEIELAMNTPSTRTE